ncbi:NAD(P)/FAD-dependent oxidoreductase [Halomonas sp.]|uniref:NAD(P)/FAD-dependent oxidoreductase n=1 Tax=Halomonas sp. TaxID=1486246 RepID=UPI003D12C383
MRPHNNDTTPRHHIVIGGGIVGLASALTLRLAGHEVTLLERDTPGHGASLGNAGTFATYAITPLAQPALLRQTPYLLTSRDSPFHLRWRHMPRLLPWLLRFVAEARPARVRHNIEHLSYLMARADSDWQRLLVAADADSLVTRRGCLYTYQTQAAWEQAIHEHDTLAWNGIRYRVLNEHQTADLEPALVGKVKGSIWYPDASHVADPLMLCDRLRQAFEMLGGTLHTASDVERVSAHDAGVVVTTSTDQMVCDHAVITAGIATRELAGTLGDRMPLEAERGYHLEYAMDTPLLQRPCCIAEHGCYMTPMAGRLRVAGTVELGRASDPANPARYRYLERAMGKLFPELGAPTAYWMGCRPSLPDTLPIIGRSAHTRRVHYGVGHGHLGLTLAATTGALIEADIHRQAPEWLAALAIERFR